MAEAQFVFVSFKESVKNSAFVQLNFYIPVCFLLVLSGNGLWEGRQKIRKCNHRLE